MKQIKILLGAAALTFAASQAMAALPTADQTFATKAAAGGAAEVALGHLATQNAAANQVKQFGERMITDHSKANQELQVIGKAQNLNLPTKPDEKDQTTERRLAALNGQAFDNAYIQDMVQDHEQDIADFRQEASAGQDPALKAFAQKYLPVLEQHLQMAKAAEAK